MDFRNTPRYQQGVQKIMALPAHYRAVISTRALDEKFGDEMERKLMLSALHDANKQLRLKELEIRQQESNFKIDLANRKLDTAVSQAKKANVFDIANLGLSTFMGYGQLKRDRALSEKYDNLLESLAERKTL
jgi:hypothetical protein